MRADSKKIVFFGFPSEKDGLGKENQLFPRTKMVLGRKTNFFLGKTKKNPKKKHLFETLDSKKIAFLVFP